MRFPDRYILAGAHDQVGSSHHSRESENRKYVRSKFEHALSKLGSESSDPDPEIQALARTIIEKVSKSIEDHKIALEETEKRRDRCVRVYNGRD